MTQYVGLDVSLKETKLHVLDGAGNRVWRGRCATDPRCDRCRGASVRSHCGSYWIAHCIVATSVRSLDHGRGCFVEYRTVARTKAAPSFLWLASIQGIEGK